MEKILKRVKFDIDENDPFSGVKTISLVDEPAVESNFEYFNKAKKAQKFKKLSVDGKEYEGVVHGLALRADYDILRYDEFNEPYYGYFSKDAVKKIRDKYHKEMMTNQFNTDHNGENYVDAYLIESFIIDSEERLADVKKKGIEEANLGDWYVATKVEDEETFKRVLNGELNGFSVEIYLSKILEKNNYKKNDNNIMNFIVEQFKQIQARLDKLAKEKQRELMEKAKIAGTETSVEYGAVGEPVVVYEISPEGIEVPVPAPAGEHALDNGQVLVVDEMGVLVEMKPAVPAEEAPAEEPMEEMPVEGMPEVESPDSVAEAVQEKIVEAVAEAVAPAVEESIAPVVEEAVKSAEEAVANIQLQKQVELLSAELQKALAEIENLKKAPIAKPVTKKEAMSVADVKDFNKLSTFEKLALKNGITIPEGLVKK